MPVLKPAKPPAAAPVIAFMRLTRIAPAEIAAHMADPRVAFVTFPLPPSRIRLGAPGRLGARPIGTVLHAGARFCKFRMETGGGKV